MSRGRMSDAKYLLNAGAQNALNVLLQAWTDDNNLNREMVETLLVQSMFQTAGLA